MPTTARASAADDAFAPSGVHSARATRRSRSPRGSNPFAVGPWRGASDAESSPEPAHAVARRMRSVAHRLVNDTLDGRRDLSTDALTHLVGRLSQVIDRHSVAAFGVAARRHRSDYIPFTGRSYTMGDHVLRFPGSPERLPEEQLSIAAQQRALVVQVGD